MRKRRSPISNKRRGRHLIDEPTPAALEERDEVQTSSDRLSAFYTAGPMLHLDGRHNKDATQSKQAGSMSDQGSMTPAEPQAVPLTTVQGTGQTRQVSVYANTVRLQGRTDATFNGGSFRTDNVRLRRGTGCEGCEAAECMRVTGTLVATYSVATTVTLPRASDFPDLTPCQRARVQNAITNVLAPHEQQHVAAFRQYNGTTRRQFNLTLCRSEFDSAIRAMFEAEESTRRSAAQAASDALDPFHFDVDLNCEDRPNRRAGSQQATGISPAADEE